MLHTRLTVKAFLLCTTIFVSGNLHMPVKIKMPPKIIGGKPTAIKQFPFAVQFWNMDSLCGGVILNKWAVLTAAHCFDENLDVKHMEVCIGSSKLYDEKSKKYRVRKHVIHSNYGRSHDFEADIAIVFVEEPFKFERQVKKAKMVAHTRWKQKTIRKRSSSDFVVLGWGSREVDGDASPTLRMTKLRYVNTEKCKEMNHDYSMTPEMFCLYGAGKRDTCSGDSGGGVLWNRSIVGLVSHGPSCALKGKPGVYISVYYYRKWINKVLSENTPTEEKSVDQNSNFNISASF